MNKKREIEVLKNLGKRIAEIRQGKGITQIELGYKCDIEKPNMNRIEKGNTNPTFLTLYKISKELDVGIEEIVKQL